MLISLIVALYLSRWLFTDLLKIESLKHGPGSNPRPSRSQLSGFSRSHLHHGD
jgi:hypothetical protein